MAKEKTGKTAAATVAELVIPETIEVHLKGKDWPIVMSPRVLMLAEKATGLNLLVGLGDELLKPSMEFVCGILYGSLRAAGAAYSFDEVTELVTFKNLPELAKAIGLAGAKLAMEVADADPTKAEAKNGNSHG